MMYDGKWTLKQKQFAIFKTKSWADYHFSAIILSPEDLLHKLVYRTLSGENATQYVLFFFIIQRFTNNALARNTIYSISQLDKILGQKSIQL